MFCVFIIYVNNNGTCDIINKILSLLDWAYIVVYLCDEKSVFSKSYSEAILLRLPSDYYQVKSEFIASDILLKNWTLQLFWIFIAERQNRLLYQWRKIDFFGYQADFFNLLIQFITTD